MSLQIKIQSDVNYIVCGECLFFKICQPLAGNVG